MATIRSAKQEQKLRKKNSKKTHPQKCASTLALKWYPQDLIGRAKLFDISAAGENQGGKCIFMHPGHFPFGLQTCAFYGGHFVIWLRVLVISYLLFVTQSPLTQYHSLCRNLSLVFTSVARISTSHIRRRIYLLLISVFCSNTSFW